MALPTILVDSNSGSDTAASGAGPSTALTGSAASTSGDGLTVTLDGSPNLSGVAIDGSHVIFVNDSTAGKRNFGKITNSDNSAKTVTVADAFGLSISGKAWAIGGKRASIGSTTSTKLFSNNNAAGDCMPGWIVEMQSGHTETIAAAYVLRRAGDTTGDIVLRGKSGAAVMPIVTFSNNGNAFNPVAAYQALENMEIRNSNGTKTASTAIAIGSAAPQTRMVNLKISHSTNNFWRGVVFGNGSPALLRDSEIGRCADFGCGSGSATWSGRIVNCYIHHNGNSGITIGTGSVVTILITNCLIVANTGDGILDNSTGAYTANNSPLIISNNTIDGNSSDGIEYAGTGGGTANVARAFCGMCNNNLLTNNTGYGVNFSGSGVTDLSLQAVPFMMNGNVFYGNLGDCNLSLPLTNLNSTSGIAPCYTATNTGDYTIGPGLKAKAYPSTYVGNYSNTLTYTDPGVSQRPEPKPLRHRKGMRL